MEVAFEDIRLVPKGDLAEEILWFELEYFIDESGDSVQPMG